MPYSCNIGSTVKTTKIERKASRTSPVKSSNTSTAHTTSNNCMPRRYRGAILCGRSKAHASKTVMLTRSTKSKRLSPVNTSGDAPGKASASKPEREATKSTTTS